MHRHEPFAFRHVALEAAPVAQPVDLVAHLQQAHRFAVAHQNALHAQAELGARTVQLVQGVTGAAEFAVADDQQVGAAPGLLVNPFDRPFDRRLHIGAAVETLAHQFEQGAQAVGPAGQVAFQQLAGATERDQFAAAAFAVCRARRFQHRRLGNVLRRAAHRARGVQAHDHRPALSAPRGRPGRARRCCRRVGHALDQHRFAFVGQQAAFRQAGAPEFVQHRVADLRCFAAQQAFDPVRMADAAQLAGCIGQARLAFALWRFLHVGQGLRLRCGVAVGVVFRAADRANQFGQRLQVGEQLADALRFLPFVRTQNAAQFVPAQCRKIAKRLQQRLHLLPVALLPRPFGAKALHGVADGGVALQTGLQVDDAVEVPQQGAQDLQRQ